MNREEQHFKKIEKEGFFLRNNLSENDLINSGLTWDELLKIGVAHANNTTYLKDTAILLSSVLQQGNEVHSVRWRVKDPEHLMSKIIRKRMESSEKYNDISEFNYTKIVTDLIGIRVLHLFKKDWQIIHEFLTSKWALSENPVVYIREGDETEEYSKHGCSVKVHNAGYRSIHYITTTRPMRDEIFTEIQVRTIFEEGWSEIDHRVKYPNFSNNKLLNYFLMIFNRFSGSADEMGSFVLELRESIDLMEYSKAELAKIEEEKAESLRKIDDLIAKLSSGEERFGEVSNELKELKDEIKSLKRKENVSTHNNIFNSLDFLNDRFSKDMQEKLSIWSKNSIGESLAWLNSPNIHATQLATDKLKSLIQSNTDNNYKLTTENLVDPTLPISFDKNKLHDNPELLLSKNTDNVINSSKAETKKTDDKNKP